MSATNRYRTDVVVVGARAAGAATALLLSRLGHDVVLVDRAVFPSDTVSTHQLARPGVLQLRRWGLLDAVLDTGTPPIHQVTFIAGGQSVTRTVKDRAGVDFLIAPRRYILDTLVAEAAAHAGAKVRYGVAVTAVRFDDAGRCVGVTGVDRGGEAVEIDARLVVGADGLGSIVARSVGASVVERRPVSGGVQYAYYGGVAWQGIEMFIADRSLVGVFPTHDEQACIWIGRPTAEARLARQRARNSTEAFTDHLELAAPELASRLRTGERVSPVGGMLRMPNQRRRAYGLGWALVGDAAYHRDAVTGYGISDAYRDAEFLAVAIDDHLRGVVDEPTALAGYQRRGQTAARDVFDVTCALAAYPPVDEFVALQRQLSRAIDVEATALAALPIHHQYYEEKV
jgi:2-polyprenyl-6-methoxyphenol hydroxylase-like FAD-dependent oxidoreductase